LFGEEKNYAYSLIALDQMYKNGSVAPENGTGIHSIDYIMREMVQSWVLGHNTTAKKTPLDVFPGPMATQLCRRHLPFLSENEYWITEKSDGVRAMLFSHHIPDFPRWSKWPVEGRRSFVCLTLFDNLRLEYNYQQALINHQPSMDIRVEHKDYRFFVNELILEDKSTKKKFRVQRDLGWQFSYLFDRKVEFFLCTEQFVFVTPNFKTAAVNAIKNQKPLPPIEHQKTVILDGEIIFNLVNKCNNYTVYDAICCTNESGETVNLCATTMLERKNAIISCISEPHHFYNSQLLRKENQPVSLLVLPKHFYKKHEFEKVRSFITESPTEPNKYLYKNYNLNDGLVFTPNSPDLYTFAPGSSGYLLKWKWPDKLTSDFLVVPQGPTPDQLDDQAEYFHFYYWSRHNAILYRTMKVSPSTDAKILDELRRSKPGTGRIVECSFEVPHPNDHIFDPDADYQSPSYLAYEPAMWKLDLIRDDKNHANGFKVIANTLENVIENITEDDLRLYLGVTTTNGADERSRKLIEDERNQLAFERELSACDGFAHFKVQYHHEKTEDVKLSFSVQVYRENNPHPITQWLYYYNFEDCLFGNDHIESDILQILSREGVAFARCVFVSHLGKWKIVDAKGQEDKCSGTQMLRVLEYYLCLNVRIQQRTAETEDNSSKRKRLLSGDNEAYFDDEHATKRHRQE